MKTIVVKINKFGRKLFRKEENGFQYFYHSKFVLNEALKKHESHLNYAMMLADLAIDPKGNVIKNRYK